LHIIDFEDYGFGNRVENVCLFCLLLMRWASVPTSGRKARTKCGLRAMQETSQQNQNSGSFKQSLTPNVISAPVS